MNRITPVEKLHYFSTCPLWYCRLPLLPLFFFQSTALRKRIPTVNAASGPTENHDEIPRGSLKFVIVGESNRRRGWCEFFEYGVARRSRSWSPSKVQGFDRVAVTWSRGCYHSKYFVDQGSEVGGLVD